MRNILKWSISYILITIITISILPAQLDTMNFDLAADHPGFTFTNWNHDPVGMTIFSADLITPSIIEKDTGTFDLISFRVGPFAGGNDMRMVSDAGDTLLYNDGIITTHVVNWLGITSLTMERPGAGFAPAADHDVFIYSDSLLLSKQESYLGSCLRIGPNPARTEVRVFVKNEPLLDRVYLFDEKGRLVLTEKRFPGNPFITLDVSGFAKGVYLAKAQAGPQMWTERLIIH